MGAPDADLDFDDLTAMTADLGVFVTEFEDIEDPPNDVQDAVGGRRAAPRLAAGSATSSPDGTATAR